MPTTIEQGINTPLCNTGVKIPFLPLIFRRNFSRAKGCDHVSKNASFLGQKTRPKGGSKTHLSRTPTLRVGRVRELPRGERVFRADSRARRRWRRRSVRQAFSQRRGGLFLYGHACVASSGTSSPVVGRDGGAQPCGVSRGIALSACWPKTKNGEPPPEGKELRQPPIRMI